MSDERQAEIEAAIVTLFICRRSGAPTQDCPSPNYACENGCDEEEVQYVRLDRVRDARGDDEAGRCGCNELLGGHRDDCPQWGSARSPQDEDHECRKCSRMVSVGMHCPEVECPYPRTVAGQVDDDRPQGEVRQLRKFIVDWTENGDGIILDPSVGPPHPVVGTHDLAAPTG
jgi:hypothetical protein